MKKMFAALLSMSILLTSALPCLAADINRDAGVLWKYNIL